MQNLTIDIILSTPYAFTESFRLGAGLTIEAMKGEVYFDQFPMQYVTMSTSKSHSAKNRKPRQIFLICRGIVSV